MASRCSGTRRRRVYIGTIESATEFLYNSVGAAGAALRRHARSDVAATNVFVVPGGGDGSSQGHSVDVDVVYPSVGG